MCCPEHNLVDVSTYSVHCCDLLLWAGVDEPMASDGKLDRRST